MTNKKIASFRLDADILETLKTYSKNKAISQTEIIEEAIIKYLGVNMEYAEDCIHLKACRRLCKMHDIKTGRGCNTKTCTAYISQREVYTKNEVKKVRNGTWDDCKYGLDKYDILVEDFATAGIDDLYERINKK